jgi:hypothetical protein
MHNPADTQYRLVWQADGNLVVYRGGTAVWATSTENRGQSLNFQEDGNLVIRNSSGAPIWDARASSRQHSDSSYSLTFAVTMGPSGYGWDLNAVQVSPVYGNYNYYQSSSFK